MDKRQQLRESLVALGFDRKSYSSPQTPRGSYIEIWSNGDDKVKITWATKKPCVHPDGFVQSQLFRVRFVCPHCNAEQPSHDSNVNLGI